MTQVNNGEREVDIIVCGGGAAGCVLAGRLAMADPNLEILIIEGGIDNKDHPQVIRPAMYLSHLTPDSKTALFYIGKPSEALNGRSAIVPSGGMLGGGSSINLVIDSSFLMYARASESDYNDWNQPGWSTKDLKPLLAKTETYHIRPNDENHGYSGPLHVSYGGHRSSISKEWYDVAKHHLQLPVADDLQGFKETGMGYWAKWIDPKTGRRQDAAHGFIHPQLEPGKSKLSLQLESKVVRVLFDGTKAIGVEYVPNIQHRPNDDNTPIVVKARKYVVVSSGAMSTPQILERSGIGAKSRLEKLGIDCVVDLPGVGEGYQDHQLTLVAYHASADADTLDDYLRGKPEIHAEAEKQWQTGQGLIASNALDAGTKIRPSEEDVKSMSPSFKKKWDEYFDTKEHQDKPLMFIGCATTMLGDHSQVPPGNYFSVGSFLEYPFSRGSIHITGKEVTSPPDFDPGFLTDEADMWPHVWAYKKGREVARRMPSYRGELVSGHPHFSARSSVTCRNMTAETSKDIATSTTKGSETLNVSSGLVAGVIPTGGLPGIELSKDLTKGGSVSGRVAVESSKEELKDLVYSEEDDKVIEDFMRSNIATTWHSMATCAMKSKSEGGVVDSKLNVYETQNLKVVDLSICPGNVGANTYSTALLVGEKGAMLLMEELGIKCTN